MKHCILGNGEVAKAVGENLTNMPYYFDKGEWEELTDQECDILHITIPYTEMFIEIVIEATEVFDPTYVVIHSTVKPQTTSLVSETFENVLYSPIRGRHLNNGLGTSVTNFVKYFAGNEEVFNNIKNEFELDVDYWGEDTSSLEYAKIASTNYMYWNLIYQKYVKDACGEEGWDFEKVYTEMNKSYNNGYNKTNPEFCRPVYKYVEDKYPGGHCLRPNIHLYNDKISSFIKKYEQE